MRRDAAEAHIKAAFKKVSEQTTRESSTYRSWVETWSRTDCQPATPEDVQAFKAVPRGQGHHVSAVGAVITLRCELDSGD